MFLMGSFQIVLFLSKYRKKQDSIISIIENKVGDVFDGIYTRLSYKNDNKVIDYNYNYNVIMQGINFNQRPTSYTGWIP